MNIGIWFWYLTICFGICLILIITHIYDWNTLYHSSKTFNGNNAEHDIELYLYGRLYNLMDNYYNNTTIQYNTIYIY